MASCGWYDVTVAKAFIVFPSLGNGKGPTNIKLSFIGVRRKIYKMKGHH